MTESGQPPLGVETTPSGPVVPLPEAAKRLNKDPRTLIRAIKNGELRGGASLRAERVRWYVYTDELPPLPGAAPSPPSPSYIDDLQAQLVSQMEANRLLIAAQQDLLDAEGAASDKYRSASRHYLDALAQFMTPGHLGELTRDL
jgi:hypothetical protein